MIALLLILAIGIWIMYQRQNTSDIVADLPALLSDKLDQLWSIAHEALQSQKYLRAEKALLTILRVDERNASAYNRLGILYAKQKSYKDAVECFEIAQSLEPSASSLHNVGLIYYKTALAFEQALELDSELPARHIAYAKVQEKLGNDRKMIEALEKAVAIEEIPQALNILADAYERTEQPELALQTRERAAKLVMPATQNRIKQPRRVVM